MNPIAALIAEAWAMERCRLEQLVASLRAAAPSADFGRGSSVEVSLTVENGVARIPIHGIILKTAPAWLSDIGISATGTEHTRRLLTKAVEDPNVQSIELCVDSPGGTVAGVQALADDVFAARGLKPLVARISDLAASAAYWIASQASTVTANNTAAVGSIGVYTVLADFSKLFEANGVKVHVVSNHELKGAGAFGSEITETQLADVKRNIDTYASLFTEAVARGRGASVAAIEKVSTGQVWIGTEAVAQGLVDEIEETSAKHKERAMDIEKLKAELAAKIAEATALTASVADLTAKLEAALKQGAEMKAAVDASQATQRDMLIKSYEAGIAPADLAAVKQYGEFCGADMAKFEGFLKARAPATRPSRVSDPGAQPGDVKAQIPDAVLAVAKQFGNSVDDIRKVMPAA